MADLRLTIAGASGSTDVEFRVAPSSLLRLREGEEHGDFVASYARWRADGLLASHAIDARAVTGMTEYLRIRR
jgi:hypothetical protein